MALLGQMEMEIHAAAPLETIRETGCLLLELQELDNCAIVPPALSLEGIAKEETQETGEKIKNEKCTIFFYPGFLVADVVGLGMGSSHFQRGERGKLQTLEM